MKNANNLPPFWARVILGPRPAAASTSPFNQVTSGSDTLFLIEFRLVVDALLFVLDLVTLLFDSLLFDVDLDVLLLLDLLFCGELSFDLLVFAISRPFAFNPRNVVFYCFHVLKLLKISGFLES